ncbi:MAG: hypothetical protein K6G23_06120 [Lachnospiraceae bacterium]|nr:hypothetical protein [Lachnospiraceae bacterium]
MIYTFGVETEEGAIAVGAGTLYEEGVRAGFVTEKNRSQNEKLTIPEINSGFDPAYWYAGEEITKICQSADGCEAGSDVASPEEGMIPLLFKCDVPAPGIYRVSVTIRSVKADTFAELFLGRRRGYLIRHMEMGEEIEEAFFTDVSPIVARGSTEAREDSSIDLALVGEGVKLCRVEVTKQQEKQTIYIAGDSTVTDQFTDYPYLPGKAYSGWGQMLSAYIGRKHAVSNHAHSGLTTESFRSEGHYDVMAPLLQAGDLCLFQFAHNDQKLDHLKAKGGYRERLLTYIEEVRAKNAVPVLVTPLARNTWKNGDTYNDLLEEYAEEVLLIGKEMQVPVVDLHAFSMALIKKLGREEARKYYFPSDYTHTNDYGAYYYAGYVATQLKELGLIGEVQSVEEWTPCEALPVPEPPKDRAQRKNPEAVELFADLERPEEILTRADAVDFVIRTMKFFPTNVYNDVFDDVVGHETYAGSVECAYQNGIIPQENIDAKKFYPKQAVSGRDFWVFLQRGYSSRRPDALQESMLPEGFLQKGKITRGEAAAICKMLQI